MMTNLVRLTVLSLLVAGCGGPMKYQLRGSETSPGSDAKLVAEIDKTRNMTSFELTATNLTPPDRVVEGGTAYVVWVRRDRTVPWSRAGALQLVEEGRAGEANLTVSEAAFDLLVSAEVSTDAASPSGKSVFSQRVEEQE